MKIAVVGCAHGELEKIYDTIKFIEKKESISVDLLLCCGDFQSVRTFEDLFSMAVPEKYRRTGTFFKYFKGEKTAPVLTVFVGGNHEASSYLQELPYGGWIATNIYYMGYASVIDIGGLKIGGISGIFKDHDYNRGHFELPPYDEKTIRSVYHIRELEVFRLMNYSNKLDIFLSHDWPTGIWNFGNLFTLLSKKPWFKKDIDNNTLGAYPLEIILSHLKPRYWFAAHLHCKFAAMIPHNDEERNVTRFLALDKCLPGRSFLQIVDIAHDANKPIEISYDAEWLAILRLTNSLFDTTSNKIELPFYYGFISLDCESNFKPSTTDIEEVQKKMDGNLVIDKNFDSNNLLTKDFCKRLNLKNPCLPFHNLDEYEKYALLHNERSTDANNVDNENDNENDDRPSFIESIDLSNVFFENEENNEAEESAESVKRLKMSSNDFNVTL